MSSAVGIKKGANGTDTYNYNDGVLKEIYHGKAIWTYTHVSEKNGLLIAALRQNKHSEDVNIITIDRNTKKLYKTVIQSGLNYTSFGECKFTK